MSEFGRTFDVDALIEHITIRPKGVVATLFANWVVAGERPHREGKSGLRIAIRNNYLNFYICGQSVAKLSMSGRKPKPKIKIHWKYFEGKKNKANCEQKNNFDKLYITLGSDKLEEIETKAVRDWINTAKSYVTSEKAFVDMLVACNPGIIDIEMGLPGPTAPRMDIVIAQSSGSAPPTIAFWEVKCIDNPELRSRAEFRDLRSDPEYLALSPNQRKKKKPYEGPQVIGQVGKYKSWMLTECNEEKVAVAYQANAKIMAELCEKLPSVDESEFGHLRKLGKEIRLLAKTKPDVVVTPGIAIGTSVPDTIKNILGEAEYRSKSASFEAKQKSFERETPGVPSHLQKLKNSKLVVEMYPNGNLYKLPELSRQK